MKKKFVTTSVSALMATGLVFGLAACGDDAGATAPAANAPAVEVPAVVEEAPAEVDVLEDLQGAREAVAENINWGDQTWEQIMLADDVPSPEMKYGLLVVPFHMTDAGARHTRTVSIDGSGNFVVEVTSADTGITWQIDQDGNVTQAG